MGTNYYAVENKVCYQPKEIHIGKCSAGWLFDINDCAQFHSFKELKSWLHHNVDELKNYKIFNEYNEELTVDEMLKIISEHQTEENASNPKNFDNDHLNVDGYRINLCNEWC